MANLRKYAMAGLLVLLSFLAYSCNAQYENITMCDCSGNCGDGTTCVDFPFDTCVSSVTLCDGTPQSEYVRIFNGVDPGDVDIQFFSDASCASSIVGTRQTRTCASTHLCVEYPTIGFPSYGFEAYVFCNGTDGGNNNTNNDQCNVTVAFYGDNDECNGTPECEDPEEAETGRCENVFLGGNDAYSYSVDCEAGSAQVYDADGCSGEGATVTNGNTCVDLGDYSVRLLIGDDETCEGTSGDAASSLTSLILSL
jgi:hypothetical protein